MAKRFVIVFVLSVFALSTSAPGLAGEEESPTNPILLGVTTALTGPTSFLGRQMRAGMEVYFHHANANGGVDGRPVELIVLDDGYRKDIAVKNMDALIQRGVLSFIGNVGTPTATVTLPIAQAHHRLFFGAYTGSTLLRDEFPEKGRSQTQMNHVANYRASYYDELNTIIRKLFEQGVRPFEIGVFAQKGAWGTEIEAHVRRIFEERGYSSVKPLIGFYTRNTSDIKEAVFSLIEDNRELKAIILAGLYFPSAKCVRTLKPVFPKATFFGISFIGADSFIRELGKDAEGVLMTQVVPLLNSNVPVIRNFKTHLQLFAKSEAYVRKTGGRGDEKRFFTHVALEGYIVAKLFVEILKQTDDPNDSKSIIAAMDKFEDRPIDIGLFGEGADSRSKEVLRWDERKRQFCNHVWTSMVKEGRLVESDWAGISR